MSRILHVAAVDFTGVKLLRPQLDALVDAGFEVRLACGRTTTSYWSALQRFRPVDIAFSRSARPRATGIALLRLRRLVRDWKPDVVHLHTPAASLPTRLLPRSAWPRGTRIVYTVHGYLHPWPPRTTRDRLIQRLEQRQAGRTDLLLFQSREDLEESRARGYASRLAYLGNGVGDAWFEVAPPRRRADALHVLYMGRLVREKGVLDLVRAVRHIQGVSLELAGAALASDRDSIEDELAELMEDPALAGRVRRSGDLDRPRLLAACEHADVVCLPSYREGMPRSVIEGLAAARPALVTDIRGCRELVVDGTNGHLVPAGDVLALRDRLAALLALDAVGFDAMASAARASVDPGRRESVVFDRLTAAYADLGVRSW